MSKHHARRSRLPSPAFSGYSVGHPFPFTETSWVGCQVRGRRSCQPCSVTTPRANRNASQATREPRDYPVDCALRYNPNCPTDRPLDQRATRTPLQPVHQAAVKPVEQSTHHNPTRAAQHLLDQPARQPALHARQNPASQPVEYTTQDGPGGMGVWPGGNCLSPCLIAA